VRNRDPAVADDPGRGSSATLFCKPLHRTVYPARNMASTAPQDAEFSNRAEQCLASLQAALDGFDPDELEADLAGGVLRIAFADGRNCILNRQTAAHQIWLAEGASAWHFTFDPTSGPDGKWMDTKGRGELRSLLRQIVSRRLGRDLEF